MRKIFISFLNSTPISVAEHFYRMIDESLSDQVQGVTFRMQHHLYLVVFPAYDLTLGDLQDFLEESYQSHYLKDIEEVEE